MRKIFAVDGLDLIARGVAQSSVRVANERSVLTLIALNAGVSKADLARLSGLGPQTTSRIVAELEAQNLVTRGSVLRGRRGQPATPYFINPEGVYVLGVEIGWRHVEVVLIDMAGTILAGSRHSHDHIDRATIVAEVCAEIAAIRAGMNPQQAERLLGIGVATPSGTGPGACRQSADVAAEIAEVTGLEAQWFNDGTSACWAEYVAQLPSQLVNVAYFQLGRRVAAGVVVEGNLRDDHTGKDAKLGDIMVADARGKPARVHEIASFTGLEQRLQAAGVALPSGDPMKWDWDSLGPVAHGWIEAAGQALALSIMSTRAVIEQDLSVIDAVMPRDRVQVLLEHVNRHLDDLGAHEPIPVAVSIGRGGGSVAASGAAQLVIFQRYFSRGWSLFAA